MQVPVIDSLMGFNDIRATREAIKELAASTPIARGKDFNEVYVLDHETVRSGLTDRRLQGIGLAVFDACGVPDCGLRSWYGRIMFTNEGQPHHRLRKLVGKAFTPKAVAGLREYAAALVGERIGALREAGGGDLLAALRDVPMHMMCRLLGVPEEDVKQFDAWVADLSPIFTMMTPEQIERASAAYEPLRAYLEDLIARRETDPRTDLISGLIAAEDDGDRLSRSETVDMVLNLLVAGQDTTFSQMGCTLATLFDRCEFAKLQGIDGAVLTALVDETLRFENAIGAAPRTATTALELHGHPIEQGAVIYLGTMTAGLDPEVWDEPQEFRADRFLAPNTPKMMAFGGGAHFCLGAWLARITLEEAARGTIAAQPHLTEPLDGIEWEMAVGSNPARLPIAFDA